MVDIQADTGFDTIDFSFCDERYYGDDISDALYKGKFTGLRCYTEDKGVSFHQAHSCNMIVTDDSEINRKNFKRVTRCMRNASYLGAKIIVIHPLACLDYSKDGAPEQLYEMNMEFYNHLKQYCEEYDICVALENVDRYVDTISGYRFFHSVCSTPEEYIKYIDTLDRSCFAACFNVGHSILVHQDPAEFIIKLGGDRIKALHIHESNGWLDSHTLPFLGGVTDWHKIMRAIRTINYTGVFNFEAGNFLKPLPRELYPIGAKMIAETGRYLVGLDAAADL